MAKFTQADIDELNSKIHTTQQALQWTSDNLHPNVAKASSFGAEDAVVIDIMIKINPRFRFFTLDTGRLPQETYDIMDITRKKYDLDLTILFPDTKEVEDMVREKGSNLFYDSVENRKLCCEIRKVHPINKILNTLDGWITGLRRDQSQTRSNVKIFEIDHQHNGILKINPIIDWTWEDIWKYIKTNNLSYNKLLDKGYPSIGCQPCTRPIKPGESIRSGRWWWEKDNTNKECGLHVDYYKDKQQEQRGNNKNV